MASRHGSREIFSPAVCHDGKEICPAGTKPSFIVRHGSILLIIGAIHRTLGDISSTEKYVWFPRVSRLPFEISKVSPEWGPACFSDLTWTGVLERWSVASRLIV